MLFEKSRLLTKSVAFATTCLTCKTFHENALSSKSAPQNTFYSVDLVLSNNVPYKSRGKLVVSRYTQMVIEAMVP